MGNSWVFEQKQKVKERRKNGQRRRKRRKRGRCVFRISSRVFNII
jgi:hypothetical protein